MVSARGEALEVMAEVDRRHHFDPDNRFCSCGSPTTWVGPAYEAERRDHINGVKLAALTELAAIQEATGAQ